jgi:hypothetical protein
MSSAYFSVTTLRLSFSVGVRSPAFSLKSTGSQAHFCTICALDVVLLFAVLTPWLMYSFHAKF